MPVPVFLVLAMGTVMLDVVERRMIIPLARPFFLPCFFLSFLGLVINSGYIHAEAQGRFSSGLERTTDASFDALTVTFMFLVFL